MTPGVLDRMEGALNPFPEAVAPGIEARGPGLALVGPPGGKDVQSVRFSVRLLPVSPYEAFVPADPDVP